MGLEKLLSRFRILNGRKEVEKFKKLDKIIHNGLKSIYDSDTQSISPNTSKTIVASVIVANNSNYLRDTGKNQY